MAGGGGHASAPTTAIIKLFAAGLLAGEVALAVNIAVLGIADEVGVALGTVVYSA